ncbi:MAG: tetratricopeptide repeat protein [Gemmatimonadetes bacterium]|jgi:tetratricopeptide (TPR) repeat protein|nr:tetratricopeptide repeat protein [Gemmatimonadota bacterium]MBT4610077.1 tetratricopeptide repeat protein [Gemmatimonadota bacterium]MBT5056991.1 tetratricopeptide repeat protein [Gemmatimonadota bacterium]MBT5142244.1 tetratricopeptide repeat protein [Gemmatimonadota bacterium]MBT5589171.1 tetratricopeptide repeat protein [Gemmatimonadota bacterium]
MRATPLTLPSAAIVILALFAPQPAISQTIPVTTQSPAAHEKFIEGRALFEKLRAQEARPLLQAAVAADPDFALAWLNLAQVSTSAKDFFDHVDRAASLVEHASEAEGWWIVGFQAGVQGHPQRQLELYSKLAEAYPNDPRSHNLLGIHHFVQQNWAVAITNFEQATDVDPSYSAPYNMLGYARRFAGDFDGAEKAFQTYIRLIPDDPNPYDSYAELLMKTGRFEESIKSYRKALQQDGHFIASHIGIATNLNFLGQQAAARAQLEQMLGTARNDGERRGAYFAMAVSQVSEGNLAAAISCIAVELALAAKIDDATAMAGDHTNMGLLQLESGNVDAAESHFEAAIAVTEASDRDEDVKETGRRAYLYNKGTLAVARGDYATARALAADLLERAQAIGNSFAERLAHELIGIAALAEGDASTASSELAQANQQDPYNLYRQALAADASGDDNNARQWLQRTIANNPLNNLNDALVRSRAMKLRDEF